MSGQVGYISWKKRAKSGEKSQKSHFVRDKKLCNFLLPKYFSEIIDVLGTQKAPSFRKKKVFEKYDGIL